MTDSPHRHPDPVRVGAGSTVVPDDLYVSPPPWDINRPQAAFVALAAAGDIGGHVLDVGCGTGEHTLMAAGLGLHATGIDLAENALQTAREKARERGLTARFLRHDARQLADLNEAYDTVLDCGLFHIFTGEDRDAFVCGLRSVVPSGGRYFMLGFSDRQPRDGRPHRLTRDEIVAAFADGWRVDALEAATIEVTTDPTGIPAWQLAVSRI